MDPNIHTTLAEILHSRRQLVAQQWQQTVSAVAPHASAPPGLFFELTQQLMAALAALPTPSQEVRAIGAALAQTVGQLPEILGCTQAVLMEQLMAGLTPPQADTLKPRLAMLLGHLSAGFLLPVEADHPPLAGQTQTGDTAAWLTQSEASLQAIFNGSHQSLFLLDPDGTIRAFNQAAQMGVRQIHGRDLQVGQSVYDYLPSQSVQPVQNYMAQVLNRETLTLEVPLEFESGCNWFQVGFYPVISPPNRVTGVCITAVNIQGHKRTIDLLAESESRLLMEMETMLIVTRALVSEVDLKNLLEFIMAQAEHLTSADGSKVLLLSNDEQHLEIVRPGERWVRMETGAVFSPKDSLAGQALAARQVVISNTPLTDPACAAARNLMPSVAPTALLCAPLIVKNKPLGVLVAWHEDEKIFDNRAHRLITMLADHAALAISNARLHQQGRQLAVANERQRIARELHDSVAQQIHGIGLAAQTALRLLNPATESKAREPIEYAQSLARTALSEIRERVQDLHPTALSEEGLSEALKRLCDTLGQHHNLQIDLNVDPEAIIPPGCQDDMYYVAREALSNIIRHAGASRISIALSAHTGRVRMSIADNGAGFDSTLLSGAETVGLRNMEARCGLMGGAFSVQSAPGQGTNLVVDIPAP